MSSSYGDIAFSNQPYNIDVGSSCGTNFVNSGTAGKLMPAQEGEAGHRRGSEVAKQAQEPADSFVFSDKFEFGGDTTTLSAGASGGAGSDSSTGTTGGGQGTAGHLAAAWLANKL